MTLGAEVGLEAWLEETRAWSEAVLEEALLAQGCQPGPLLEAMRHALLGGGKRLRPALVRLVASELGAPDDACRASAAAVELVHAYSLVHDDLPCMDDDALRRGRPTVHVRFGEALAVLAGDALQAAAFERLSRAPESAEQLRVLARAAGAAGMVGGQALDLAGNARACDGELVRAIHAKKTAALFGASAELGALCAGPRGGAARAPAREYGLALGRLFQAVDDVLDVTGDAASLGKTPGKDQAVEKATLVAALGLESAREEVLRLAGEAEEQAARAFGPAALPRALVRRLAGRRS